MFVVATSVVVDDDNNADDDDETLVILDTVAVAVAVVAAVVNSTALDAPVVCVVSSTDDAIVDVGDEVAVSREFSTTVGTTAGNDKGVLAIVSP